jgi:hypothetical protein
VVTDTNARRQPGTHAAHRAVSRGDGLGRASDSYRETSGFERGPYPTEWTVAQVLSHLGSAAVIRTVTGSALRWDR